MTAESARNACHVTKNIASGADACNLQVEHELSKLHKNVAHPNVNLLYIKASGSNNLEYVLIICIKIAKKIAKKEVKTREPCINCWAPRVGTAIAYRSERKWVFEASVLSWELTGRLFGVA